MRTGTGEKYFFYTSHRGSTEALIAPDGTVAATYEYSPYGATAKYGPAATDNPFRYLGAYQALEGNYHFGHRFYNPIYTRFTQPDPSRQELNPYQYAKSNPCNRMDVVGLYSWSQFDGGLFGGAVGLVDAAPLSLIVSPYAASPIGGCVGKCPEKGSPTPCEAKEQDSGKCLPHVQAELLSSDCSDDHP